MHYAQCSLMQLICYYKTTVSSVQLGHVRHLIHPLYMIYCSLLGVNRGLWILSLSVCRHISGFQGALKKFLAVLSGYGGEKPNSCIDPPHQSLLAAQTRVQEAARRNCRNTVLSYHPSRDGGNTRAVCWFPFVSLS